MTSRHKEFYEQWKLRYQNMENSTAENTNPPERIINKRRILSLKEKGEIIAEVDRNPHMSKVKLSEKLDLATSTLATILANREAILKTIAKCGSASSKRKNSRTSPYQYLEDKLLDWLIDRQEKGIPINSVIIREQAKIMAMDLGMEKFTASSGWIDRFKNRHGLGNKAIFDESVAECKNRWASIRDSFPETPEIIRKKRNPKNGELIFTRSIYDPDHVLGNSSDGKNESHLMPLENSTWPEEDYPNFPDQSSSDHESNVNFPEIKVEVGSYDHEGKPGGTNDPTTERDNCSDYGYIVPNSLCEVVTEPPPIVSNRRTSDEIDDCSMVVSPQSKKRHDYEYIAPNCIYNTPESQQPTVSSKRTSGESIDEGIPQSKKRREDSETGAIVASETDTKPPEHPIETFFKSMAATVMTFPPHLMAIAKLNVCKLVTELELRALTEKNPFEGSQDRINEMMSENVLASSSAAAENRADS